MEIPIPEKKRGLYIEEALTGNNKIDHVLPLNHIPI